MKARKQSTTTYPIQFLMVLSSDKSSPATGKTVTVTLSKNGGSFGAASGAITEIANGWYSLAGNATDRNTLGELLIHATASDSEATEDKYEIVLFDPFDAQLGLSNLDAAISSRLATAGYTAPPSVSAIRSEIDSNSTKLDATVSSRLASASYTAPPTVVQVRQEIDSNSTKLDVAVGTRLADADYTAPPSAATIRAEIDSNSTKLDVTVGSRLATAGYTAPPTAVAVRAEIDLNSTKLDVAVGTRLATAGYTAPDNVSITAIKAITDLLTLAAIADAVLKRDWTLITGEASRSVLNALRAIRNGFEISGTTLTVLKEDDATTAYTRTITTDSDADPITAVGD